MNTPICDFVAAYAKRKTLRLHMPGHKGYTLLGVEELDITEIEGADVLYSANGIISESEDNARLLFDSGKTLYSTEGSSLSIRAMLHLAALWGESVGKDRVILAARNAHRVFHSGAALLDLEVEWIYGEGSTLMSCDITPDRLERAVLECEKRPFAVYLTSPDYLGNMLDIGGLAAVCKRYGILCLVDNAHGAYLRFMREASHPLELGAHMCADSAHKTLPALTGGGYLHIAKGAPSILFEQAENAMSLFASTSPSYLVLQSLDLVNKYLDEGYSQKLYRFCILAEAMRSRLIEKGYELIGDEPLKITLNAKAYGYFGDEIGRWLEDRGIVCEHADRDVTVLMLTPEIGEAELSRLEAALLSLEKREPLRTFAPMTCRGVRVMSIREATLRAKERLPVREALGRVLADSAVSCPPAVPIAVCGELIDENAVRLFEYYGIDIISVVC